MKATTKLFSTFVALTLTTGSLFASSDYSKWKMPAEVPAPKDNKITPERIELGKLLYFDTRLSASGDISCATCHHPNKGWTDMVEVPKAVGFEGRVGPRNSPTVLNTAFQRHQFWDGRVRTLEQQALGPIEADVEMNMPLEVLIPKLNEIEGYKTLFKEAYPESNGVITEDYLAKAIATFERTAISQESPFDRFINGDKDAMSEEAQEGFELFTGKANCQSCHDGFNFSDGSFHNMGLHDGELHGKELGRYLVKRRAAWYGVFKTPTLRDIAKSGPYFHDGSIKSLEEATMVCNTGRFPTAKNLSTQIVNADLSKDEIRKIVTFMEALSGPNVHVQIPTTFPQ